MTGHLNGNQGDSPVAAARIKQADYDRLAAFARHFDQPLSRVIRTAIQRGLVQMEAEQDLPDDGQSAAPDNEGAPAG